MPLKGENNESGYTDELGETWTEKDTALEVCTSIIIY